MIEAFKDLLKYLRYYKKWWLLPILMFLIIFGALVIYSQGTAIAPFVYTFF